MGYFPNKVKRRRHSWANNLGRKLVLLGATGSHTDMYLCEYPNGKRFWRTNGIETYRILACRKHYFLELPGTNSPWECSSRSMTGCTVKGAKLMEIV